MTAAKQRLIPLETDNSIPNLICFKSVYKVFKLFDIFKINGAGKSLAYSLEFRSPERTLTDDEVANAFTKIVEALKSVPGVEVREG